MLKELDVGRGAQAAHKICKKKKKKMYVLKLQMYKYILITKI